MGVGFRMLRGRTEDTRGRGIPQRKLALLCASASPPSRWPITLCQQHRPLPDGAAIESACVDGPLRASPLC